METMADSASDVPSTSFNPFDQVVFFRMEDGTRIPVDMAGLRLYAQYAIRTCINYATQIGASIILLAILLVLTKHEKRRSPIFIFNTLSLILNILRTVFSCLYFTGAWWDPYSYFSGDYSNITDVDIADSVAATILTLALVICIEISLVLQVRVVCVTIPKTQRYALVVLSSLFALTAVAIRFVATVLNVQAIMGIFTTGPDFANASNITITISICFFSLVFVGKLAHAIRNRRRLGLKQFGPMQIIFVMGCNTMVIPAIFSILQYFTSAPMLGSQALTLVAIFLPLSAIWASTKVEGEGVASRGHDAHHKLFGSFGWRRDRNPSAVSESTSTAPLKGPASPMSQKTADSETTQVDLEIGNETHVYGTHTTTTIIRRLQTIDEKSEHELTRAGV
ncbi:mating-type alpha-pheromone receptor PreB [Phyllosticta citriasiana]|uniref:Mating-type alpha-pheromone receptor PreB n=1 Tax=Phyllosticta citriasiana TaxID=595635 RepID=A0ABR1KMF0_9PEZI